MFFTPLCVDPESLYVELSSPRYMWTSGRYMWT